MKLTDVFDKIGWYPREGSWLGRMAGHPSLALALRDEFDQESYPAFWTTYANGTVPRNSVTLETTPSPMRFYTQGEVDKFAKSPAAQLLRDTLGHNNFTLTGRTVA